MGHQLKAIPNRKLNFVTCGDFEIREAIVFCTRSGGANFDCCVPILIFAGMQLGPPQLETSQFYVLLVDDL
jgi:hypothetical protein